MAGCVWCTASHELVAWGWSGWVGHTPVGPLMGRSSQLPITLESQRRICQVMVLKSSSHEGHSGYSSKMCETIRVAVWQPGSTGLALWLQVTDTWRPVVWSIVPGSREVLLWIAQR